MNNTPPTPSNALAVTALIFGIISFCLGFIPFFVIPLGAVGLVLGIIALSKRQSKALAVTGIVLSCLGILASLLMGVFATWLFQGAAEGFKDTDTGKHFEIHRRFDNIQYGMTKSEVAKILGDDTKSCRKGIMAYHENYQDVPNSETCSYIHYENFNSAIEVSYKNGKVSEKDIRDGGY